MKKIAILSPETVPLPLKDNCPPTLLEGTKEFSVLDKCVRTTAPGKRSWRFAEYLSKEKDFEVTLFIPDLNMPNQEFIDKSKINFNIKSYSFKAANWEWSSELDRKLIKFDFVIIQSTTGTGFINCSVLPSRVQLLVDGWVPFLAELPATLLTYERMYRKVFWNKKFIPQYQDLLRRSNCVLYANDRQHYYYEGQFFANGKLDWSSFKFSPLLKVPYGIDQATETQSKLDPTQPLKLLWYGPVYPWYDPEILIEAIKKKPEIYLDFVGVLHPRYGRIYNNSYKKLFDSLKEVPNINVVEEYCDNSRDLFTQYDAGIVIAKDWLEEKYSHRCRILDMISNGLPVITNKGNALYEEFSFLKDKAIHTISTNNIGDELEYIKEHKAILNIDKQTADKFYTTLNWEKVLFPVTDYIKRF